jgi:hypothetical protein
MNQVENSLEKVNKSFEEYVKTAEAKIKSLVVQRDGLLILFILKCLGVF